MSLSEESCDLLTRLNASIEHHENSDELLWQLVISEQGEPFQTFSGLDFTYRVKIGKQGKPTGELLITRKESSKTLTKSSILLAFHKVLQAREAVGQKPCFKGPKAIGQIFGISYIYGMFLKWNLIEG